MAILRGNDKIILELCREEGWKQCPGCGMAIQLRSGCFHMTCAMCRFEFCFKCSCPWGKGASECTSRCIVWDEANLFEGAEARVRAQEEAQGRLFESSIRERRLQIARHTSSR
mmetsp:Transcript_1986/g.4721  ORF Transcript_1986/g.4721 Transcript_1986/m.4721 type:complete len:113 (-) Transcript_1986:649-987(-)